MALSPCALETSDVPFGKPAVAGGRFVAKRPGVGVPPHWSVNFAVSDADNIADRAVALGGGVVMAPADTRDSEAR